MKAFSMFLMRFLRLGLEWVLEWVQNDLNIDPFWTSGDWSRDGPQITLRTLYPGPSHMAVSNEALFTVLLTIAERLGVSSKDWIAPPT